VICGGGLSGHDAPLQKRGPVRVLPITHTEEEDAVMGRTLRVFVLATLVVVAMSRFGLTQETTSPLPAAPYRGEEAPEFQAEYQAGQAASGAGEESRIRSAVDVYFKLRYECAVSVRAYDLGFLIESAFAPGADLYSYEMGRIEYSVAAWEKSGLSLRGIDYRPEYESVVIDGRTAVATLCPKALVSSSLDFETGGEVHVVRLVLTQQGWKLIEDNYDDDFRRAYPPGTDFGELTRNLPDDPVPPPDGGPGDDSNEPQPSGMGWTLKLILGVAGGAALAAAAYAWSRRGTRGLRQG
jgi:hypothetical protein